MSESAAKIKLFFQSVIPDYSSYRCQTEADFRGQTRAGTQSNREDAWHLVQGYVEYHNNVRLNSAVRLHHAEGHARRASAGDSRREGSEAGGGPKTAPGSSAASCVKKEEPSLRANQTAGEMANFRIPDNPGLMTPTR
jgi:hypothetical protein